MKKTLVVFFSVSDTVKDLATQLASAAGADIAEIVPEVPYTDDDIDWTNRQSRVAKELDSQYSRPRLANTIANIGDYELIYLGFPIWWYTSPAIINTFLESHNFGIAEVIPFATSDGSKMGKIHRACAEFRRDYPQIHWREGRLLNNVNDKLIADWAHQNG